MRYPTLCLTIMILFVSYYSSLCRIIEDSINSANIPQVDEPALEFIKNFDIPELSIAITKDDKLVYAKAFSQNDTVSVNNRFRIASVSKPFTSITIFKLIEEGKLKLTDKVFGEGGVLGTKYGTQPFRKWITDITVYHLVSHTAGGWTALDANDPMLQFPSWPVAELITWTLDNYPLSAEPGTERIYSNFGYCLLGRIIEELTGQSYEHYVRSAILEPVGITDMWIAGNTLADRRPGEVIYYSGNTSDPTEDPYTSINIRRMDSHGGWIATAKDLVRLLVHVTPDILDPETFKTMTTPIELAPYQALGWGANATNQWCAGSLPGNLAYMIRTSELGYNWSIMMNTRYLTNDIEVAIESLVWGAIRDPTTQWPTTDSFLENTASVSSEEIEKEVFLKKRA